MRRKTRLCHIPEEPFDFLGYTFGRCYSTKTGRAYIGTKPSKKSIKHIIQGIHRQTARDMEWLDAVEMVTRLNWKIKGWANYFCLGPVTSTYRFIDRYTTTRLRRWLCKKHKATSGKFTRFSDDNLHNQFGLVRLSLVPQSFPWAKT